MFGGFKADSSVRPSDQHDLASEVFPHEGDGVTPLFSQELEEGVLGHLVLGVLEGAT